MLLDLAARPDVETVYPQDEPDIYVLSTYKSDFATHVNTLWPSRSQYELARDRVRLLERARELDICAPETRLLTEWEAWDDPSIIKSRYSIVETGEGVHYPDVEFHDTSGAERPDLDAIVEEMKHEPIVQEYVPGDEFGFFALMRDGTARATFQHERVRSTSYAGGTSVYRKAVDVEPLREQGLRLLESLDWTGPAMVEFKRDERTGEFRLMEINGRFWGSLPLPVAAGIDFPYYYLLESRGGDYSSPPYEPGMACQCLLNELLYLGSLVRADYPEYVDRPGLLRALVGIGADTPRSGFDYLDRSDPAPFVWNLVQKARFAVDRIRNA